MKPAFFILSILLLTGSSGCEYCGPAAEPIVKFQFNPASTTLPGSSLFSRVFSPNGAVSRSAVSASLPLSLPLSLTADSTTYIFVRPNRTDTLTVFYRRTFSYQSTKCGYVLDLDEPTGRRIMKSTFPNSSAYFDRRTGLLSGPGPDVTGIIVTTTL